MLFLFCSLSIFINLLASKFYIPFMIVDFDIMVDVTRSSSFGLQVSSFILLLISLNIICSAGDVPNKCLYGINRYIRFPFL